MAQWEYNETSLCSTFFGGIPVQKKSPMAPAMKGVLAASLLLCALFAWMHGKGGPAFAEPAAITFGTIACHMIIRFLSPVILYAIFRKKYNPQGFWFRQKKFEPELYRRLGVQKWKAGVMSYDPSQFDMTLHSPDEIILNMCHAEAVHELIIPLSLLTMLLIIPFGAAPVFILTAIAAAAFDGVFVILQRYNRPRIQLLREVAKKREELRRVRKETTAATGQ